MGKLNLKNDVLLLPWHAYCLLVIGPFLGPNNDLYQPLLEMYATYQFMSHRSEELVTSIGNWKEGLAEEFRKDSCSFQAEFHCRDLGLMEVTWSHQVKDKFVLRMSS